MFGIENETKMTKNFQLYDGTSVEVSSSTIELDYSILAHLAFSKPRRSIGRVVTALIYWLNGEPSPINLTDSERYIATILYKSASASLSAQSKRLPAKEKDLEEILEDMVREARGTYKLHIPALKKP